MSSFQAFMTKSSPGLEAPVALSSLPRLFGLDKGGMWAPAPSRVTLPGVSACLVSEPKKAVAPASPSGRPFSEESKQVMQTEAEVFVRTYARTPVVLRSGKGCKVYDVEGREYLDLAGGIAVNSLGHSDPDWVKAVVEQANTLAHVSNIYYSIPQVSFFFLFEE